MTQDLDYYTDCVQPAMFNHEDLGALRSRDYNLKRVDELLFEEIGSEKPSPDDWLSRIIGSVSNEGVLQPILVVENDEGLELVDGNHRAWVAHRLMLSAPVQIFRATCENCTEEQFRETAMARTEELGWKY